jgi:CubicO group peptidase (beta-lactamase class C family)
MKALLSLTLTLFFLCGSIFGQANYPKETLFSDLQDLLDAKRTEYGLEGAAITLILDDSSEWTGVSGIRDASSTIDPDLQWNLGSMQKTYIATMILQLMEEGELALEDMLGMHLDTESIPNVDSAISIKSLLNHTSPLTNSWEDPSEFWSAVWNDRPAIWSLDQTLQYTPAPLPNPNGEHRYQGHINYTLLGLLIEEVSGNSLKTEFEQRIITPLGLENTVLCDSDYDMTQLNGVYGGGSSRANLSHNSYLSSRAAINASSQEAVHFMRELNKGILLNESSLNLMREDVVPTTNTGAIPCGGSVEVDYGLGLLIPSLSFNSGEKLTVYGHSGTGINKASAFHSVDDDWTVGVFSNEFDNPLFNAMIFDVLCHLQNNPVYIDTSTVGKRDFVMEEIQVYPNPSSKEFHITLNDDQVNDFQVFDLHGRQVKNLEFMNMSQGQGVLILDPSLPKGLYMLKVNGSRKNYTYRLLLQ